MYIEQKLGAANLIHRGGLAVLVLSTCLFACQRMSEPVEPAKKNVLFILVDDLGYADIGTYNPSSFYETPNIDAFANSGVVFTQGYAANPVCSPSRAAIMTGKHPTRLQATDWFHVNNYPHRVERFRPAVNKEFMPAEERTLAEIYQDNGYRTAFLGKWHLGEEESHYPDNQGFDINVAGQPFGFPRGGYFSPYNNPSLVDGPVGEYLTDRLANEAASLIKEYAKDDSPFLVYLSFYSVHVPLEAPEKLVAKYKDKQETVDSSDDEFALEDQYFISENTLRLVRTRQSHPTYAAMIETMDAAVGRVLTALEVAGVAEDTVVVFTSDNGGLSTSEGSPTSNLPLRGGKGWLYEGGVRVPLIIRAPGQQTSGLRTEQPAIGMDFIPTLAALTGINGDQATVVDGMNLAPSLTGTVASNQVRPMFWHYPHYSNQGGFPGAAVRRGKYKLLQNFEDGSYQLYDLSSDIGEKVDIKADHPKELEELKTLLNNWYADVDARFLRPRDDQSNVMPWAPTLD